MVDVRYSSNNYEDFHLLGYKAVYSVGSQS
jgi:hypothetical protein